MEYIRLAASRMLQLLDELLELSRIGRKVNSAEDVTLQQIAQAAQEQVAGQVAERQVKVRVTEVPVTLHGDRQRLMELFQNLLDNAVKFMGDQASPLIEIGVEQDEMQVVLFVKDNGSGIDQRHHGKLFGLFEKLHPGTPRLWHRTRTCQTNRRGSWRPNLGRIRRPGKRSNLSVLP